MVDEYDPTEVFLNLDSHIVTGYAEGTMIQGERLEDKVELNTGAQGEQTFVINANDGGEISITLKHNSPSIQKIKELYNNQKRFAVNAEDQNFDGNVGIGGSEAMIANPGGFERGDDVSDKEITILVADYDETFEGVA